MIKLKFPLQTIEFGERYDAPPTFDFDKNLKDKMVGKMAKAGAKNLLLKNLIPKQKEEATVYTKVLWVSDGFI